MRRLSVIIGFLVLPALAQPIASGEADWEQLRAQAAELRERVKQMRTTADQTQLATEHACREKLLMSGCMEDAQKTRQEAERSARRVELDAIEIEKRLRKYDYEVRLQKRAEKERDNASKAAERAEKIRAQEEDRRIKTEERAAKAAQRQEKARRE